MRSRHACIAIAPLVSTLMLCALAASAPHARASSEEGSAVDYATMDASLPPDDLDPPGRPLSIDEAIALGLQNNLDVEVNRYQPYVSQLDSEAAWGAYDPTFSGQVDYNDSRTRNTFAINRNQSNEIDALGGKTGLTALIPYWGASVELSFDGRRTKTNNTIEALSPKYESGLMIGGTVPLMRGLVWNQPWTQVKTLRLNYDADLDNFTTSVMNTVQQIISAYWNLVATKEQVRVALKSLESNNALLDQTRTQYEVGVVSKVEVVQAEAGVANSEFNLIVARNTYRNAQDSLIAAVLGNRLRAATTLTFDPTTRPEFSSVRPVNLNHAVETAFARRPELAAAQRRLDQGEVQLKFAKNQRLPQVDLNVSYRTAGVEGRQNPDLIDFTATPPGPAPPGSVAEGSFGDTTNSYFATGAPRGVTAMGVVSIPLGNVTARKNVSKARIELRRANSQITQLKQQIIVSVRAAARGLLASAHGVEAAERRRIAAKEQLRAERIRLEHGESTPFDVLQRESDLVDAESQKISALQSFRNAQATLERERGTILDTWDVAIDSVRQLGYDEVLSAHD